MCNYDNRVTADGVYAWQYFCQLETRFYIEIRGKTAFHRNAYPRDETQSTLSSFTTTESRFENSTFPFFVATCYTVIYE